MSEVEIVAPGTFASIQDLGRTGWRHLGVPRAGAADRASLRLANRLVGNPEGAAAIESLMGGLTLRLGRDTTIALTGAPVDASVDGGGLEMNRASRLPGGATVALARPEAGLRTYVALAGGLDVAPVLGSRSTDTLSRLGPAPLRRGDVLPLGNTGGPVPAVDAVPVAGLSAQLTVAFDVGPREGMFVPEALQVLAAGSYTVTPDVSRIGMKLDGPGLVRTDDQELRSEGMVPGAIEVPPSGKPIVLLSDCPTTGGYPVIGVVRDRDLDALGQLRPGATLRFRRRAGHRD